MSKSSLFSNKAFQQETASPVGFNLVHQVNGFNSVFNVKPLDESEATSIEKLLVENYRPGSMDEDQVAQDVTVLKQLTSEIRAIGRQGTVLMGERVYKAKELLKPYRDGTFTRWLETAFGTRKTGYNALSYFELYKALPKEELRDQFKKIPLRAAYVLASRVGDIEVKSEIIRDFYEARHDEIVNVIQEKLPVPIEDKRVGKNVNDRLVAQLKEIAKKIKKRKISLSDENVNSIEETQELISEILGQSVKSGEFAF